MFHITTSSGFHEQTANAPTAEAQLDLVMAEITCRSLLGLRLKQLSSAGLDWSVRDGKIQFRVADSEQLRLCKASYLKQIAASPFAFDHWKVLERDRSLSLRVSDNDGFFGGFLKHLGSVFQEYPSLKHVPIAACETPCFNASACPSNDGRGFIVLNGGIRAADALAYLEVTRTAYEAAGVEEFRSIAKCVFGTISYSIPNSVDEWVNSHFENIDSWMRLMEVKVMMVDSMRAAREMSEENMHDDEHMSIYHSGLEAEAAMTLGQAVKMFIVLHEYGHVALRHINEIGRWPAPAEMSRKQKRSFSKMRIRQEFEADRFAYDHLLRLPEDSLLISSSQRSVAPTQMFAWLDVAESGQRRSRTPTHPRALDRLRNLGLT